MTFYPQLQVRHPSSSSTSVEISTYQPTRDDASPSSSNKNSRPPPRQHPPSPPPPHGVTSPSATDWTPSPCQFGITVMGSQKSKSGGIVNDVSDNQLARVTYSQFGVQVGPQECENTIKNMVRNNTFVGQESNGNINKNAKNKNCTR